MSKIKSALEIAMEKMDDIEVDEDRIRLAENKKEGQKLAGTFLNEPEMTTEDLLKKIQGFKEEQRTGIKEAMKEIILSNISLPSDDLYEVRFDRIEQLALAVSANKKQVTTFFNQIKQFFKQYIDGREDFLERLQQQFGEVNTPEKQQQLMQLSQQNLAKMEKQFNQALKETKEKLNQSL